MLSPPTATQTALPYVEVYRGKKLLESNSIPPSQLELLSQALGKAIESVEREVGSRWRRERQKLWALLQVRASTILIVLLMHVPAKGWPPVSQLLRVLRSHRLKWCSLTCRLPLRRLATLSDSCRRGRTYSSSARCQGSRRGVVRRCEVRRAHAASGATVEVMTAD